MVPSGLDAGTLLAATLTAWATTNGHQIGEVLTDVGSGVDSTPGEEYDRLCRTLLRT